MFSDEDFIGYFKTLEEMLKSVMVISTNLSNELSDQSIRNRFDAIQTDDIETLRFVREQLKNFDKK